MNISDFPVVNWRDKGWTIPGQIKKILEETGEVAEAIALFDGTNAIKEALDTIQTNLTLIDMILDNKGMSETPAFMTRMMAEHKEKLQRKGYL